MVGRAGRPLRPVPQRDQVGAHFPVSVMDVVLMVLILLSVAAVVLESIPEVRARYDTSSMQRVKASRAPRSGSSVRRRA